MYGPEASEWYIRHVATPIATVVQAANDALPFALSDALPYAFGIGVGMAAVGLWRGGRKTFLGISGWSTFGWTAIAGMSGMLYALNVGKALDQPDAYSRFAMRQVEISVQDHRDALRRSIDEGMRLERSIGGPGPEPGAVWETDADASWVTIPDSVVCDQVERTLRSLGKPVVPNHCIVKSSRQSRDMRANDNVVGLFDGITRDLSLEMSVDNYWRPMYFAHELAHSHHIREEAQAELVAYVSLTTASGPYGPAMRQVGHLWRARAEAMALNERVGESGLLPFPSRAMADFTEITRKEPEARQAPRAGTSDAPASMEDAKSSAPASMARYDLGFVELAHAWDRSRGAQALATPSTQ